MRDSCIKLPLRLQIKLIQPSNEHVYHFKNINHGEDSPPHFHICLSTKDDCYILLTMITSKVEKKKKYYSRTRGLESLIEINKSDLDILEVESVIDCNNPWFGTAEELESIIDGNILIRKTNIPSNLINEIRKALKKSPRVRDEIKEYLD